MREQASCSPTQTPPEMRWTAVEERRGDSGSALPAWAAKGAVGVPGSMVLLL